MSSRFRIVRQKENRQRLKYVLVKELASFASRKDAEEYLKEERLKEKRGMQYLKEARRPRIRQMRAETTVAKFERG
jgi:hypothetical protein